MAELENSEVFLRTLESNTNKPVLVTISDVVLDASLDETHSFTSTATSYPVESGATISDHIHNNPLRLSITGLISNNPVSGQANAGGRYIGEINRADLVYKKLMSVWTNREPITVITALATYENMVLTGFAVPRDVRIGDAIKVNLDFTQISIVSSTSTPLSYLSDTVAPTTAKKQNLGSDTVKAPSVTDETTAKTRARSVLKSTTNTLGVTTPVP